MREALRQRPPQLLLTNYVMVELLLVRPEDQRFLDRAGGGLRFLVFDEVHTYRGRQGADVAMLIRRLKERCAAPNLVHVGTSATMVASPEATPESRRAAVADFAARLFGHAFAAQQVIEETLVTFAEGGLPTREELLAAMVGPLPDQIADFRRHLLARWVEWEFGVEPEGGGRLRRRVPRTLAQAAEHLARQTGREKDVCAARLREILNCGGRLVREDGGRAFAFKLHQFIGQGRALFATLEAADVREFSLEGQVQAGGARRQPLIGAPAGRREDVVAGGAVLAVPELRRVLHRARTGVRQAGLTCRARRAVTPPQCWPRHCCGTPAGPKPRAISCSVSPTTGKTPRCRRDISTISCTYRCCVVRSMRL